jgi:preprotein translocase subunit Sec61beta
MTDLVPVLARILLRYAAGALVTWGIVAPEDAQILAMDPDLAILVGAGLGAVVEAAYAIARRNGGAT